MKAMITGFAGSLGSEFTRYFLERGDEVVGVDNSEWAVAAFPDHERLEKRLDDFACQTDLGIDLCVHAAAFKHVDLIESNRLAAETNNVHRTFSLYALQRKAVLFISTDKAVEPSSWYGETKKRAEELTHGRGGVVARLGNVMGSSGSVIPKWEAAIEKGDPLPVTDLRMARYMLPAREAVEKVMALLPFAAPGSTIIPEMGPEVTLSELIAKMLEKHGKSKDYPTVTIGMRPGEKLREKLKWDDEEIVYQDTNGIIVRR